MRSTAHFKGHPIHPALIPFPFACLSGAFLFDAAGWLLGVPVLHATARHLTLAGIGFGLLAAVPGVIDYLHAVPPRSSAKNRARKHGLLNVTALLLFAAAWWTRRGVEGVPPLTLLLEAAGAGALSYAGWLGGVLVNRNLIGVDHRYANKGKWSEAVVPSSGGTFDAAADGELEVGHMKLLHAGHRRIVLARTPRGYVAFDDRCTHRGGSLAGGVLIGDTVQCLWHGSQFDVHSGAVKCGPAKEGVRCYTAAVKNGRVQITV